LPLKVLMHWPQRLLALLLPPLLLLVVLLPQVRTQGIGGGEQVIRRVSCQPTRRSPQPWVSFGRRRK